MEKKPVIGVLPLYDAKKNSYWMLPQYLEALEGCGAIALVLPPRMEAADRAQALSICDGLLFPGGQDIEPALYGQERTADCAPSAERRDELEFPLFLEAFARDMPMLGICRGVQLFNAALGGTLCQHLPQAVDHDMTAPYDRVFHTVALWPDTPLVRCLGCEALGVNSYHHQAITALAPALSVMATAPDGVIEAVYAPGKTFVWGIQWHPEYFWQGAQRAVFQTFVESCRAVRGNGVRA